VIARTAREAGDWELAEYAAQQMMEHDPNYAGSHYARALVGEHKGDRASALEGFTSAEKYWRGADSDLPELLDARKRMAALLK
jgi:Tfp pilus assembly protein PilF